MTTCQERSPAAGTALASSSTYDPWGAVLASSGPSVQVGYQGQWTDPVTQQVEMGSRMYRTSGGFADQDTKPSESGIAVTDDLHAYADDNPVTVTDPSGHAPRGKGSSSGPSAADVAAANARAADASAKAAAAEAAYSVARAAAATAQAAAHGAAALARTLNSVAARLVAAAAATARAAAAAFQAAQAELKVVESWREQGQRSLERSRAEDLAKATHEPWWEPWKAVADVFDAGKAAGRAIADEGHAAVALGDYLMLEGKALALQALAVIQRGAANLAQLAAKGPRALPGSWPASPLPLKARPRPWCDRRQGQGRRRGGDRRRSLRLRRLRQGTRPQGRRCHQDRRQEDREGRHCGRRRRRQCHRRGRRRHRRCHRCGGKCHRDRRDRGGSAIGAAATVAGGALATAAAAAAGGNIGGAAAAIIAGAVPRPRLASEGPITTPVAARSA